MLPISISATSGLSLVEQVASGLRQEIEQRRLRAGARLPSIRALATALNVSRFTVVEAYDRLVATGHVQPRQGAGFFVRGTTIPKSVADPSIPSARNEELVGLIRKLLNQDQVRILAGGPWLPSNWLDEEGIRRSLMTVARKSGSVLLEYGNPLGYAPLRQLLSVQLAEEGIDARPSQIVLTHGASQALDLIMRLILRPGDTALVDDPGYYNLFGNMRFHGVRMIPVPRNRNGPDLAALETLAAENQPKLYFTQSAMQNPTGTDIGPHAAHRILQCADRYGFRIVEDDIFRDLRAKSRPALATLDQLHRVIYVRSFSKTLSGSLRIGYVAASQDLVQDLTDLKMLSAITSSQHTERMLYTLLSEGHYRKFLERLRSRVDTARDLGMSVLIESGFELYVEPDAGMFLWARQPHIPDAQQLLCSAAAEGILIAPGAIFRPYLESSPWLRFNVTTLDNAKLQQWLMRIGRRNTATLSA